MNKCHTILLSNTLDHFNEVLDAILYCRKVGTPKKYSRYIKYLHNNPETSEDKTLKSFVKFRKAFREKII